jgi:hypothetical protein
MKMGIYFLTLDNRLPVGRQAGRQAGKLQQWWHYLSLKSSK